MTMPPDENMPRDTAAEALVLGAFLLQPSLLDLLGEFLTPECFSSKRNTCIYDTMVWLQTQRKPIDAISVSSRLQDIGALHDAGGLPYITSLGNAPNDLSATEHHGRTVFDAYRLRKLIAMSSSVIEQAVARRNPPQEIIDCAESSLLKIVREAHVQVVESNKETIKRILREIHDAQSRARDGDELTGVSGIRTAFKSLDKLTSGLHGRQLTVLAARPGLGKTSIALQQAHAVAAQGIGVLFFSFEMSRDELIRRLLSVISGVSSDRMRGGGLSPRDWSLMTKAAQEISSIPLAIDDTPTLHVRAMRSRVMKQMDAYKKEGKSLGLVVVDYIQWVKPLPESIRSPLRDQIAATSKELKTMAKEERIPVVALAALNRQVEQSGKIRWPRFSDIRDCGNIESDADNILFIHRDAKVDQDKEVFEDNSDSLLILAKQRGGRGEGTVKLTFDGPTTSFRERDGDGYASSQEEE